MKKYNIKIELDKNNLIDYNTLIIFLNCFTTRVYIDLENLTAKAEILVDDQFKRYNIDISYNDKTQIYYFKLNIHSRITFYYKAIDLLNILSENGQKVSNFMEFVK